MMESLTKEVNPMSPSVIIWTQLKDPDRSKQDRLDGSHPREPVSPSMLYAYSLMRGSLYDENDETGIPLDPLYCALYNAPLRKYSTQVYIPRNGRSDSMESLNKKIKFYWDPVSSISYQESLAPDGISHLPFITSSSLAMNACAQSLVYEEFCQNNSITVGINHYKGDAVNANFGYLCIGNVWVDPDSIAEVNEALLVLKGELLQPSCVLGPPCSIDRGPHIMCDNEANQFYQNYLSYVTEDIDIHGNVIDQEGDPRLSRISPETFKIWAAGAKLGEHYEETQHDLRSENVADRRASIDKPQLSKRPEISLPHSDNETERFLSDVLSFSSNSNIFWSAPEVKSVDPIPVDFTNSHPCIQARFLRQTYVKCWVSDQWNNQGQTKLSSLVEEVYSTACQRYVEHIGKESSDRDLYAAIKASLQKIRDEGDKALYEMQQILDKAKLTSEQNVILKQQVIYLQNFAELTVNPDVNSHRFHIASKSTENISHPERCHTGEIKLPAPIQVSLLDPHSLPIMYSSVPNLEFLHLAGIPSDLDLTPRKRAFIRHLKEQFYDEVIIMGRILDQKNFMTHKCKQFEAETKFWMRRRDLLLAILDIQHVGQIPSLISQGRL